MDNATVHGGHTDTILAEPGEDSNLGLVRQLLPGFGIRMMLVGGPEESAAMIRELFGGKPGPPRDIVVLNAAAALFTVGKDTSTRRCAELATESIDSGATHELLAQLVEVSNRSGE